VTFCAAVYEDSSKSAMEIIEWGSAKRYSGAKLSE